MIADELCLGGLLASWNLWTLTGTALLVLLALLHCIGGYPLFRLLLAVDCLVGGFALGFGGLELYRPQAGAFEGVLAGLLGAAALLLASWRYCRLVFCGMLAGCVSVAASVSFGTQSPAVWVVSAVLGAVLAVLAYARLGKAVVLAWGIGGAVASVVLVLRLLGGPTSLPGWVAGNPAAAVVALAVGCLLAVVGIRVQVRSPRYLLTRLAPPSRRALRSRRGRKAHRAPGIAPHFTSL